MAWGIAMVFSGLRMMVMTMMCVHTVHAPIHKDKLVIYAYGVVQQVLLTEIECVFGMRSELESAVCQNDTWLYRFSHSYTPDPSDCFKISINVMTPSDDVTIPFINNSPQINNITITLRDLSWSVESNQGPPILPTTIGRQMKDEGTYGYLTETTYAEVTDEEAGHQETHTVHALSFKSDGRIENETMCNFRMHPELKNTVSQNGAWAYNISERYIADHPECPKTKINVLTLSENETIPSIYKTSQKNAIWVKSLPGLVNYNVNHAIVLKTIGMQIEDEITYADLTKTRYRIIQDCKTKLENENVIYALNVENKGEKLFEETNCIFSKHVELGNAVLRKGEWHYNISETNVPDQPDCLNTSINVMVQDMPDNEPFQVIYKSSQNLDKMKLSGLDNNNQIHNFAQNTIEIEIMNEGIYGDLTKTRYRTVSKEEAELMGLTPQEPQYQENIAEIITLSILIFVVLILFGILGIDRKNWRRLVQERATPNSPPSQAPSPIPATGRAASAKTKNS